MEEVTLKQEQTIEFKVWNKNGLINKHLRVNPDGSQIDMLQNGEKWRTKQLKVLRGC